MTQDDAYFDTLALIEKGAWDFGRIDEDNEERATKAARALVHFARLNEQNCDGCPVSEIIIDFLANLMHLGEVIHFRVVDEANAVIPLVRIATVHFNAETDKQVR